MIQLIAVFLIGCLFIMTLEFISQLRNPGVDFFVWHIEHGGYAGMGIFLLLKISLVTYNTFREKIADMKKHKKVNETH